MNSGRIQDYFIVPARIVLGGIFVYASVGKILNPADFATMIYQYQILPGSLVNLTAILMPWMELIAGVFLIAGLWTKSAAFWINAMLMVFIAAISFNLARGLEFDCGCFIQDPGAEASTNPVSVLIRDIIMLAVGILIQVRGSRLLALDGLLKRAPTPSTAGV